MEKLQVKKTLLIITIEIWIRFFDGSRENSGKVMIGGK